MAFCNIKHTNSRVKILLRVLTILKNYIFLETVNLKIQIRIRMKNAITPISSNCLKPTFEKMRLSRFSMRSPLLAIGMSSWPLARNFETCLFLKLCLIQNFGFKSWFSCFHELLMLENNAKLFFFDHTQFSSKSLLDRPVPFDSMPSAQCLPLNTVRAIPSTRCCPLYTGPFEVHEHCRSGY